MPLSEGPGLNPYDSLRSQAANTALPGDGLPDLSQIRINFQDGQGLTEDGLPKMVAVTIFNGMTHSLIEGEWIPTPHVKFG